MDYENKYRKAFANVRQEYNTTEDIERKQWLEELFPELKESEDKRISEEIIAFLTYYHTGQGNSVKYDDGWIAWLEKQGSNTPTIIWHSVSEEPEEMKELFCEWESDDATWHDVAFYDGESHTFRHAKMPINVTKWVYVDELLEKQVELKTPNIEEMKFKVGDVVSVGGKSFDYEKATITQKDFTPKQEPKFNVGDWVVDEYWHVVKKVSKIDEDGYSFNNGDFASFKCANEYIHLWTIKDAKDGDILTGEIDGDSYVIIFNKIKDGWVEIYGGYYDSLDRFCVPAQLFCSDYEGTFAPATKEQRELLFKKMKEAGYEWNPDKKELKKIGQKAIDKAKPKFHKGDWVIHNTTNTTYRIDYIADGEDYCVTCSNGDKIYNSIGIVENHTHLWTINDAMDGDILVCEDNMPFILKGFDRFHPECPVAYCGIDEAGQFIVNIGDGWWTDGKCYPATKEQCDFLFQKMRESGYEWDAKKKELKKIDQKPVVIIPKFKVGDKVYAIKDGFECTIESIDEITYYGDTTNFDIKDQDNWKLVEQNQSWSEDDEKMVKQLIINQEILIDNTTEEHLRSIYEKEIRWLESIEEKIRPKQEWSEDDEKKRNLLISILSVNHPNGYFKVNPANTLEMEAIHTEDLVNWLKNRVHPQPKQEWSEEDSFRTETLISIINRSIRPELRDEFVNWLKSFKDRV